MFQPNFQSLGIMAVVYRGPIEALQRRMALINEFYTTGAVRRRKTSLALNGAAVPTLHNFSRRKAFNSLEIFNFQWLVTRLQLRAKTTIKLRDMLEWGAPD